MIKDHAYDVAELGLTYFLRTFELGDPSYAGDWVTRSIRRRGKPAF
jgi:hypothetical protein